MENEVIATRPGVLQLRDAKVALGDAMDVARTLHVVVVGRRGAPFVGEVKLGRIPAGPGEHVALSCPHCRGLRRELYASDGQLRCGTCSRRRTRRAMERTTHEWNRLGGREEDALLRAAHRRLPNVAYMNRLAGELATGDIDRARTAIEFSEDALAIVEGQEAEWNATHK
jgi:hypothetical protein